MSVPGIGRGSVRGGGVGGAGDDDKGNGDDKKTQKIKHITDSPETPESSSSSEAGSSSPTPGQGGAAFAAELASKLAQPKQQKAKPALAPKPESKKSDQPAGSSTTPAASSYMTIGLDDSFPAPPTQAELQEMEMDVPMETSSTSASSSSSLSTFATPADQAASTLSSELVTALTQDTQPAASTAPIPAPRTKPLGKPIPIPRAPKRAAGSPETSPAPQRKLRSAGGFIPRRPPPAAPAQKPALAPKPAPAPKPAAAPTSQMQLRSSAAEELPSVLPGAAMPLELMPKTPRAAKDLMDKFTAEVSALEAQIVAVETEAQRAVTSSAVHAGLMRQTGNLRRSLVLANQNMANSKANYEKVLAEAAAKKLQKKR